MLWESIITLWWSWSTRNKISCAWKLAVAICVIIRLSLRLKKTFIVSSLNVGAVKEKSNVPVRILFLFDLQLEKLRHDKPFCLWFFQCFVPAKINVHFVLQSTKMSKKTFYYPLLFCFLRYFLNFTKFLKKICNKIFWFLFSWNFFWFQFFFNFECFENQL